VTFGASAPLTAAFAGGASPVLVAGLLYAGAAAVLVPVALVRVARGQARSIGRSEWPDLLALTVLGGIIGPVLLVVGLERLSSSIASLLLNLEAVATVLIGAAAFGEHVGRRAWLALTLVVAGGAVLVGAPTGAVDPLGVAAVAGACLCWGVDNNLSRRLSLHDVFVVSGAKAAGAAVPMLVVATVAAGDGAPAVGPLLVVGAVGYGVSIGLDLFALRQLGASREAVIFATAPFVGAVVGLLLGDPLGWAGVVAGSLMALGVVVLFREEHEHLHRHEPLEHEHWHTHDDGHHDHDHPPDLRVVTGRRGRHAHVHVHDEVEHSHRHVPDSHHRHRH
jgi:drug/metabolite transporter (DMT)-like permease